MPSVRAVGIQINSPTRLGAESGDDWNIDLAFLGGAAKLAPIPVHSLVRYDD